MEQTLIEAIINKMNCTFEYYFEDYPNVDESPIWWYHDEKTNMLKHQSSRCEKAGDLAVHYYTHGYCAIYAKMLKELFPEGIILHNDQHMIFYFDNEFYDASGKLKPDIAKTYIEATEEDLYSFLHYGFLETNANLKLKELMLAEARSMLENHNPHQKIKIPT